MIRLGLMGLPGAGKSTVADAIERRCRATNVVLHRLRLAEPLYAAQTAIYEIAGASLPSRYSQDGELLNFLGQHLRKINPNVLYDELIRRLLKIEKESSGKCTQSVLLCEDVRPADVPFIRDLGFVLVRVKTSESECTARRVRRGDLTLGSSRHSTESDIGAILFDYVIDNTGSLDALPFAVDSLLEQILR